MNRTGGSCFKMESEPNELADQNKVRLVVNLHYKEKSGIPNRITVDAFCTAKDGSLIRKRWTHKQ